MKTIYRNLLILLSACLFACQSEDEYSSSNIGYLYLNIGESQNFNTKAVSEDYNPKQIAVQIIDDNNQVVEETEDWTTWEGEQIALKPGTYTIKASSSGFDGKDSGFDIPYYTGSESVTIEKGKAATAKVICTLANVKFTVKYSNDFLEKFKGRKITVQIGDQSGTYTPVNFTETESRSAYMPEGKLYAKLSINNPEDEGKPYTLEQKLDDAKARDHFILNYKLQETGSGNITVTVDPTTHEYNYTFTVSPEAVAGANLSASAWTTFAYLKAENVQGESGADLTGLKFQYRLKSEGEEAWKDVETTEEIVEELTVYKAKVTGLTAKTTYQYRLINDKGFESDIAEMVTEETLVVPNGSFEEWCVRKAGTALSNQNTSFPCSGEDYDSNNRFWDTSNRGANSIGQKDPTNKTGELVQDGSFAAKLTSIAVFSKMAAASLYTGDFISASISGTADIQFGKPFNSRPIKLRGFYKYSPSTVNYVGSNLPSNTIEKGEPDQCAIYVALSKKVYTVNNGDLGSFIDFKNDENIIAYGELPSGDATLGDGYVEFNIPLQYKNLTDKPTHIIIVCSASKYGDYMTGGEGSTLYVDNLSLVYEGEPTLWE